MNLWGVCKKTIKEGLFFCVALLILYYLTNLLCAKDYYPFIKGFYFEPKETIDAVYIGNSSVYYYWQAPWAWKKYGIAVYPFSSGGQPIEAIPYLI